MNTWTQNTSYVCVRGDISRFCESLRFTWALFTKFNGGYWGLQRIHWLFPPDSGKRRVYCSAVYEKGAGLVDPLWCIQCRGADRATGCGFFRRVRSQVRANPFVIKSHILRCSCLLSVLCIFKGDLGIVANSIILLPCPLVARFWLSIFPTERPH